MALVTLAAVRNDLLKPGSEGISLEPGIHLRVARFAAALSAILSACDPRGETDSGIPNDADNESDVPLDAGPPGPPRVAGANFASRSDLSSIDICATPTAGGAVVRLNGAAGVLSAGAVTSSLTLVPGSYRFGAVPPSGDCASAVVGATLSVADGDNLVIFAAGGGGPAEATAVVSRVARRGAASGDTARVRPYVLAVDTSLAIGGLPVDVVLRAESSERDLGRGASFAMTGFAADADPLGYVEVAPTAVAEVVVRIADQPTEIIAYGPIVLAAGHAYTAYFFGRAFAGPSEARVVVCDDIVDGPSGRAECH